ncbi:hypothetical protein CHUAL_009977 [Chamberlinius hualienensis]
MAVTYKKLTLYFKITIVTVLLVISVQLYRRCNSCGSSLVCGESMIIRLEKIETATGVDTFNFSSSNNITGYSDAVVPNIVHLVKFRSQEIDFVEMVNIRSIIVNHRPDRVVIHCNMCTDIDEQGRLSLRGKYWNMLVEDGFRNSINVSFLDEPTHIFGKPLTSVYHASDIARMIVLMRYGGIFLDNDIYIVRPLHHFRHYEMTIGWDEGQYLGTQVILAHKDARFLKLWMESYHNYQGDKWYFNAGEYPTTSILYEKPELIHRVKIVFGVHMLIHNLYKTNWDGWRDYFAIHLLIRHRSYLDKESPITIFDENNIKTYNFTYGQMVRNILYNSTNLIKT